MYSLACFVFSMVAYHNNIIHSIWCHLSCTYNHAESMVWDIQRKPVLPIEVIIEQTMLL